MISAPMDTEMLYPLTAFRRNGGRSLPSYEILEGGALPEPYRGLLVHNGDMTSRLEAFHGGPIVLEVLHRELSATTYRREVVLHLEKNGLPVEYGAIEINLAAFEQHVRDEILEGHYPLGGILNRHKIQYHSRPRGFFRLEQDVEMAQIFGASPAQRLFGRSNELIEDGRTIARIVEVLRP